MVRTLAAFALAVAALVACSSDGNAGSGTGATACEKDTRKDVYVSGLSKSAASLSVRIVEATPGPPVKGTNAMTLEIVDAAGKAVEGASVAVVPFMPDHGHGSAVTPEVTPAGGGRYAVSKLYFAMAGLWQVTVAVTPQGGTKSEATFAFCLEG